jgi:hypothetical protein
MVSIGQAISVGASALAFAALEKSDTLNRFVNWISGGTVNRNTLAQGILHKAVELGTDFALQQKTLGERGATLLPLARGALIDNDMARMKESVAGLASEALGGYMDRDGEGLSGVGRRLIDSAVRGATSKIAETVVGDHATEKVLATMVKQHGWKPLETYLQGMLKGAPLGNFVVGQIKNIVQRAMVDNPDFDMSNNAEYRLAAGVAAAYLSGDKNYDKPLREYAPTITGMIDAGKKVVEVVHKGLDTLQDTLGIEPKAQLAEEVFARQLSSKLPEPAIDEHTSARDVAQSVVLERLAGQQAPEKLPKKTVEDELTSKTGALDPKQQAQLEEVVELLSPEQIAPLGERGGVEVAVTWGNTLDRVEASSYKLATMPEQALEETTQALQGASGRTVDVGGYRVGEGFSGQIKALDLDLPVSAMGYKDASLEMGKALWNTGWSALGFGGGVDMQDSSTLKQLYNTCGQSGGVMQEVTRYLDAELAESAIGGPMLRSLAGSQEGVLNIGDKQVKLDLSSPPDVSFQVRNEGPFVRVSIDVQYKVDSYGTDGDMRVPHGDKDSTVKAGVSILITPSTDGSAPTSKFFPMGELTSIFNQVAFDRDTGALL